MQGKSFESLEAWLLLLEFSFTTLNLQKVVAYVFPDNERAIRFYKFFGGVVHKPKSNVKSYVCLEVHFTSDNFAENKKTIMEKILALTSL